MHHVPHRPTGRRQLDEGPHQPGPPHARRAPATPLSPGRSRPAGTACTAGQSSEPRATRVSNTTPSTCSRSPGSTGPPVHEAAAGSGFRIRSQRVDPGGELSRLGSRRGLRRSVERVDTVLGIALTMFLSPELLALAWTLAGGIALVCVGALAVVAGVPALGLLLLWRNTRERRLRALERLTVRLPHQHRAGTEVAVELLLWCANRLVRQHLLPWLVLLSTGVAAVGGGAYLIVIG